MTIHEKVVYVNHLNEKVTLGNVDALMNTNNLHSHEWGYTTLNNKIASFESKIVKYDIPMTLIEDDITESNRVFEILEKDVVTQQKGKLIIGDYTINGYIYKARGTNYRKPTYSFVSDEKWQKSQIFMFRINNSEVTEEGLGYPFDYPYDYLSPIGLQNLNNTNYVESDFVMTIYGPINNPHIIIGGNTYGVNCNVYSNEYLTINSKDKTIIKTTVRGAKENKFSDRETEQGYVFKKIPVGRVSVVMPNDFNVDITIIEERSEPKWI